MRVRSHRQVRRDEPKLLRHHGQSDRQRGRQYNGTTADADNSNNNNNNNNNAYDDSNPAPVEEGGINNNNKNDRNRIREPMLVG